MNNLKSTLKLQKILPICARSFVNPHPGTENVSAEAKGIKHGARERVWYDRARQQKYSMLRPFYYFSIDLKIKVIFITFQST